VRTFLAITGLTALLTAPAVAATRLKELVSLEGVRDNQLIGYGLVVGLNGTGDRKQTFFSAQSLTNLLQQMGVSVDPLLITVRNTAAVMVTATLPGFAQEGVHIDATASAIGDAPNLQGGTLLLTSLKGIDGQTYAVAQGAVVTSGFVAGRSTNSQTVNHPTVGRVPGGAIVERAAPSLPPSGHLKLQLRQPDFTTAVRVSDVVNKKFPGAIPLAKPENSALVSIVIPPEFTAHVTEFIAGIEALEVDVDRPARVIVNERTGTIVMGKQVKVSPVAIMHGNLTVEIQTILQVSQPQPFAQGQTEVVPQTTTTSGEEKARNLVMKEGATVEQLVQALSSIGSTPRDIVAILQSLRAAGALEADLEVI
jgi:flagellar P-ring protein precursor FlgI